MNLKLLQEDEDEEDEEDEDETTEKLLPRNVALGLKGVVVAGTMYALADLFRAPQIEQEIRRGEEAAGARVCIEANFAQPTNTLLHSPAQVCTVHV